MWRGPAGRHDEQGRVLGGIGATGSPGLPDEPAGKEKSGADDMIYGAFGRIRKRRPGNKLAEQDHAEDQPPVAEREQASQAVSPLPGKDASDDFCGGLVKYIPCLEHPQAGAGQTQGQVKGNGSGEQKVLPFDGQCQSGDIPEESGCEQMYLGGGSRSEPTVEGRS